MRLRKLIIIFAILFLISLPILIYTHNVGLMADEGQMPYIHFFEEGLELAGPDDPFEQQLAYIQGVQRKVLEYSPENQGIPYGMDRGPREIFEYRRGLCFDRSRTIELILRNRGFKVRHLFLLSLKGKTGIFTAFLTPGQYSHAVSEVLTSKGWMLIGSNTGWMAVSKNNNPKTVWDLKKHLKGKVNIEWKSPMPAIYSDIFPWQPIYGLYSRHGEFFAPFTPVPDYNLSELMKNFKN